MRGCGFTIGFALMACINSFIFHLTTPTSLFVANKKKVVLFLVTEQKLLAKAIVVRERIRSRVTYSGGGCAAGNLVQERDKKPEQT